MHPFALLTGLIGIIGLIGLLVLFENVVTMIRDRDTHFWPSITRCRLCEKRVYAWQQTERRIGVVEVESPLGDPVSSRFSAIVHKKCRGIPLATYSMTLVKKEGSDDR